MLPLRIRKQKPWFYTSESSVTVDLKELSRMRNLEKFLLISSSVDFRKWIKITLRPIYILPLIFQVMLFSHAYVNADTCIDCHTNPKYKKQDIEKLKKCLTCHGIADR